MIQLTEGSILQNGKYRIVKTLGSGGFGITYQAIQVSLGRKVAIKEFFMKDYCDRDGSTSRVSVPTANSRQIVEGYKQKFIKEAQTIASLNNPHIVRIYDIFEENDTAYYVMEYHDNGSLLDLVKEKGPLSEKEAISYIKQIGEALSYVHKKKVLHLDIKPSNVLLNEYGEAVLIDFGISKHYDSEGGQTSTTPVGVSKGYAPMEQYQQGSITKFSPATDVYSLGATLYFMLTGKIPPEATEVYEEGLPVITTIGTNTMSAIKTAMTPKRKERPQSIEEFFSCLPTISSFREVQYEDVNNTPLLFVSDKTEKGEPTLAVEDHHKQQANKKPVKEESTVIVRQSSEREKELLSVKTVKVKNSESTIIVDNSLKQGSCLLTNKKDSCTKNQKGSTELWINLARITAFFLFAIVICIIVFSKSVSPSPKVLINNAASFTMYFDSEGGEQYADFLCTLHEEDLGITKSLGWVSLNIEDKTRVKVSCQANNTNQPQEGKLTFWKHGSPLTLATIIVKQAAKNYETYSDGSKTYSNQVKESEKKPVKETKGKVAEQEDWNKQTKSSKTHLSSQDVMEIEEEIPFAIIEEKPTFQGKDANEFTKWVYSQIEYPEIAKENGISGRVTVQFTIDKDGSVKDVKVLRGVDSSLDKEAVRVIQKSPKWSPGKQRGKPAKVKYTFPIIFQLEKDDTHNNSELRTPQAAVSQSSSSSNSKTIKGIITNKVGSPLPGVAVIVKGTRNGGVSDVDGRYSLKAKTGDVLIFTHKRKRREITVGSDSTVDIQFE